MILRTMPQITRFLPKDQYDAALAANVPSSLNPFATIADLSSAIPNWADVLTAGSSSSGNNPILTSGDFFQIGSVVGNVLRYNSGIVLQAGATNETMLLQSDGVMTLTAGGVGVNVTSPLLAEQGYYLGVNLFIHATLDGDRDDIASRNTFVGIGPTGCITGGSGDGTENTTLGFNAGINLTQGQKNTFLGALSGDGITTTDRNTAIGAFAFGASSNTASSVVSVGYSSFPSLTSGIEHISMGAQSGLNITGGNGLVLLGACTGATVSGVYSHSAAIGRNARITANNQFVSGSSTNSALFREYYFGRGVESVSLDGSGVTFQLTSIPDGNTDISAAGYDMIYRPAAGTGTGLGSDHVFEVSPATTSGSTQNPFVEAMRITQAGDVVVNQLSLTSGSFRGTLTATTLTQNESYVFPNQSGSVALRPITFSQAPGVLTTTSTTFQDVINVNTPSLPVGDYIISISYGWNHDADNNDFESLLLFDGSALDEVTAGSHAVGLIHKQEPKDSAGGGSPTGTTQKYGFTRKFPVTVSVAGIKALILQFRTDSAGVESSIWKSLITIERA